MQSRAAVVIQIVDFLSNILDVQQLLQTLEISSTRALKLKYICTSVKCLNTSDVRVGTYVMQSSGANEGKINIILINSRSQRNF